MPLSDLWENLEVDESESGVDWENLLTGGPGDDTDWLAFMQDPSVPTLPGQEDVSGFEGTQTNPWEAGYSGVPFDPTTATGEDIATWIAEMGYSGGTAEQQQAAQNWFINEFSPMYDFSDWDAMGYGTDVAAAQQTYATLESQMWQNYQSWEDQNFATLGGTLGELSAGYTTGVEDIEQNRRDQLSNLLTQRRSAETATVASLTDLRRQAGRSGFGNRGMQSAFTSAQASLGGFTSSAASVNAMTEQALEDIDTQFSSSAESAYTTYANQQQLELLEMQGDLDLWQAQFEQEMENIYMDWGTSIMTQLQTDMLEISEELFEGQEGWGDDITFDPFGGTWTGPMWCSIAGQVWNADTGVCEDPEALEDEEPCPEGYFQSNYYPYDCVISGGGLEPGDGGGGGAPGEGVVCPPGQMWGGETLGCVEGGSDISG